MLTEPLAEAIAEAEKLVEAAPHIRSEQDLLEGYQYLAGGILATVHAAWATEKTHPGFIQGTGPYTKMGLDNPDTLYFGTRVNDDAEYVVTGTRGTTCDLSFQVLSGNYTDSNVPGSASAFDDRDIDIDADGNFEVRFGPAGGAWAEKNAGRRNHFTLAPGASQLVVREVYSDWSQRRGTIRVERVDRRGVPFDPLTPEETAKRFARAGKALVSRVKTWLQFPEWFYLKLPVNTMTEPRLTPGGLATQFSSVGHYELADGQAMIITVPKSDAPYQGFQLGSMWYISLDYTGHQTSLNNTQAQADPDGMIRMVVSERNPGVTNWIETVGHPRGILQFRWQRTSREFTPADGPTVEVVGIDEVAAKLPFHEQNKITPEDWTARIAARQAAVANRMLG
ncbi:hypothetical protein ABIC28_004236 [Rhodococcus sp. PvR044]|uniref:hypothetical protein n=1 Tax=unclassified Rhodococcus (in: high G+C Gram-positive bacteria) TaxID=192944 RepID=UPI000BD591FE|nr:MULTISPECIES: hypothetical protein [unclassified Rhodococcus (in: high G+C Gram-positive bacteria)]MBP1159687.1 hypothetical protein [Rhodococcus sp. PvR099]PTR37459.1 hypothetical protein C8K38_12037 [Rhodococcus sp. OK611]SNX93365.1 hypothetical protein SAMN05447004_12037 [Rhodococcus sp. OK270]